VKLQELTVTMRTSGSVFAVLIRRGRRERVNCRVPKWLVPNKFFVRSLDDEATHLTFMISMSGGGQRWNEE
jgi:hypothetical protein